MPRHIYLTTALRTRDVAGAADEDAPKVWSTQLELVNTIGT